MEFAALGKRFDQILSLPFGQNHFKVQKKEEVQVSRDVRSQLSLF
jgi:hypothetical protein